MHDGVMQNKKYMGWAKKTSVDVVLVAGIDAAIAKNSPKAATYEGKDGKQYFVNWPNLTVEDMKGLNSSKAAQYKVKGYPKTFVLNPHTLEEIETFGPTSAGTIMDAANSAVKALRKAHGKGITRKKLAKFNDSVADARKLASDGKLANALTAAAKIEKDAVKLPQLLQTKAGELKTELLGQASKTLDEADALIARGETKAAAKMVRPILRSLKGTDLEERAAKLIAATKATK